jgi:heat induced stress protein YflT
MESTTRGGDVPRRVAASYGSYAEVQGAVDRLSDGGLPVERVSIVAEGLKFEERGTGRLDYDKAALGGAVSGAPVGALLGFAFGLYGPVETFVSDLIMALWGLVFGVLIGAVGAIFGVVSHALAHGR